MVNTVSKYLQDHASHSLLFFLAHTIGDNMQIAKCCFWRARADTKQNLQGLDNEADFELNTYARH